MKSKIKISILILLSFLMSCKQPEDKIVDESFNQHLNTNKNLPDAIVNLQIGFEVLNEPEKIFANKYENDTSFYVWATQTTVKALYDNIRIIEFGDYRLNDDGTWTIHTQTDKPFTQVEFNKWYFKKINGQFTWENCKDGTVKKNEEFVDMSNWTAKEKELLPQKGIWYFIGENSKGEKVMGYGEYENIPELRQ